MIISTANVKQGLNTNCLVKYDLHDFDLIFALFFFFYRNISVHLDDERFHRISILITINQNIHVSDVNNLR